MGNRRRGSLPSRKDNRLSALSACGVQSLWLKSFFATRAEQAEVRAWFEKLALVSQGFSLTCHHSPMRTYQLLWSPRTVTDLASKTDYIYSLPGSSSRGAGLEQHHILCGQSFVTTISEVPLSARGSVQVRAG